LDHHRLQTGPDHDLDKNASSGGRHRLLRRFLDHGAAMRWVYLIIIIVFVAALVIFGIQNLQTATMSFLGFSVSAPLVVLAVVVYVLGAITGGSLYALLRKSVRESRAGRSAR
jgi:lipopolysaccharide assembly protein A